MIGSRSDRELATDRKARLRLGVSARAWCLPDDVLKALLFAGLAFAAVGGVPPPDAESLRSLPQVRRVTAAPAETPRHRIVQVLNWHFVSREDFAADVVDLEESPLTDRELDERYEEFLKEVGSVQQEQIELLRRLIRDHGLKIVYLEGLTAEEVPKFNELIETLRKFGKSPPRGGTPVEQLLLEEYRLDLLRVGAAGQLLISGELEAVQPAEDAGLFRAANPVRPDGSVEFDREAVERREDAIVRAVLKGGPTSVLILGGDHDLTDNVRRLAGGTCEYLRVETKAYREAAEE